MYFDDCCILRCDVSLRYFRRVLFLDGAKVQIARPGQLLFVRGCRQWRGGGGGDVSFISFRKNESGSGDGMAHWRWKPISAQVKTKPRQTELSRVDRLKGAVVTVTVVWRRMDGAQQVLRPRSLQTWNSWRKYLKGAENVCRGWNGLLSFLHVTNKTDPALYTAGS